MPELTATALARLSRSLTRSANGSSALPRALLLLTLILAQITCNGPQSSPSERIVYKDIVSGEERILQEFSEYSRLARIDEEMTYQGVDFKGDGISHIDLVVFHKKDDPILEAGYIDCNSLRADDSVFTLVCDRLNSQYTDIRTKADGDSSDVLNLPRMKMQLDSVSR